MCDFTMIERSVYDLLYFTGERIDFAEFLQIMRKHSEREKCEHDILAAFKAHNSKGKTTVPVNELVHILSTVGERLGKQESEYIATPSALGFKQCF